MIRFNSGHRFNNLSSSKYNSRGKPPVKEVPSLYSQRAGSKPTILNQDRVRLAVLENADLTILEQEVGGADTISFEIPFNDPKTQFIENENLIQVMNDFYIIRRITKRRIGGEKIMQVNGEALWYDLKYEEPMDVGEWESAKPREVLTDILAGTPWGVGVVEVETERNYSVERGITNRLSAMSSMPDVYGGETKFNPQTMTVDFLEPVGRDSGASIAYQKNMESIDATYDTEELITRIYLYGKDNMSIADINDGLPYLDIRDDPDYTFTNRLRVKVIKDERFTNPFHLREMGENALRVLSVPRASYETTARELSSQSGLEHEQFGLGDSLLVYDKELGINVRTRIMAWRYPLDDAESAEVHLETTVDTISDLLTGLQDGTGFLISEDAADQSRLLNMSVFNQLLNSRADDGFNYWSNDGWEIDSSNGFTGNASFKATGTSGSKSISQTVYPVHRENYAVSFRGATQNFDTNDNGRVGVEIIVRYEDGSEDEPQFIPLA